MNGGGSEYDLIPINFWTDFFTMNGFELTVRPIEGKLEDPSNVDWSELDRYFTSSGSATGECVMGYVVRELVKDGVDPSHIIDATKMFEYLLVGSTSIMDDKVGQTYTFSLLSFPALKVFMSHGDGELMTGDDTMEVQPRFPMVDEAGQMGVIDISSMGAYPQDIFHHVPILKLHGPLGNSISESCGLYALPRTIRDRITEETRVLIGIENL
ncbi:MAG: hypothetical protein CMF22_11480 [Idiomarinaceae bacterium]|nr:hypothetical protein [Idiomarinaceae bacterium]|tara:strand:- start:85516 stop:86151 length:636 start_codon:yes stop_codon:yes gene_type:complete